MLFPFQKNGGPCLSCRMGGLIFSSSFKYFWARFSISSFIESHGSSTICEMTYKKAPNHFPFSFCKGSDEDLNIYLYIIS